MACTLLTCSPPEHDTDARSKEDGQILFAYVTNAVILHSVHVVSEGAEEGMADAPTAAAAVASGADADMADAAGAGRSSSQLMQQQQSHAAQQQGRGGGGSGGGSASGSGSSAGTPLALYLSTLLPSLVRAEELQGRRVWVLKEPEGRNQPWRWQQYAIWTADPHTACLQVSMCHSGLMCMGSHR